MAYRIPHSTLVLYDDADERSPSKLATGIPLARAKRREGGDPSPTTVCGHVSLREILGIALVEQESLGDRAFFWKEEGHTNVHLLEGCRRRCGRYSKRVRVMSTNLVLGSDRRHCTRIGL